MPNAGSFTYWYLQVPNLILLAMVLLLLMRLVLSPVLDDGGGIMRLLKAITRPVTVCAGAITPRIVPQAGVIIGGIIWLLAVRTVLVMTALAMGIRL